MPKRRKKKNRRRPHQPVPTPPWVPWFKWCALVFGLTVLMVLAWFNLTYHQSFFRFGGEGRLNGHTKYVGDAYRLIGIPALVHGSCLLVAAIGILMLTIESRPRIRLPLWFRYWGAGLIGVALAGEAVVHLVLRFVFQ